MKNNTQLTIITLALFLFLSGWSLIANAGSHPVGKIILAVGEVTATNPDGDERKLKRRSQIYSGDTLSTRSGARCQIRFTDKSLVALTEGSLFKVDEYHFNQNNRTKERAIYSLLKGGMRSISGAIGKINREDYQLNTPVATIGIRGTAFNIALINDNGIQNLYGTVDSGAIVLKNGQGDLKILVGQNFQVPMNQAPRTILSLPESFPSNGEGVEQPTDNIEEGEKDNGQPAENDDTATEPSDAPTATEESLTIDEVAELNQFGETATDEELLPEEVVIIDDSGAATNLITDPTSTSDTNILTTNGTLAPNGAAVGFAFVSTHPDGISGNSGIFPNILPNEIYIDTVDGVGNVPVSGSVHFTNTYDSCDPCSFLSATGTLVTGDTGGDVIGVNWGRWSGNYIVTSNGVTDTTMGSFHYIYSPNVTPATVLQTLTGAINYSLAGGTQPTDQNGATGALSALNMSFDFSSQVVTNINMSLTTPATGSIDVTSSALSIPINDFTGPGLKLDANDPSNIINVTTGYVGEIQGTFIGSNAEGLITTYGFREDAATSNKAVAGAALLTKP